MEKEKDRLVVVLSFLLYIGAVADTEVRVNI